MNTQTQILVFGEVLFDCFPSGEQVLGGAPFNVAWHLQAIGDQPQFISRVGNDQRGKKILEAMQQWGMSTTMVQVDPQRQTGQVEVQVIDDEPHYDITPDCAYDFIDASTFPSLPEQAILYHGTLALRNDVSREAFIRLAQKPGLSIFLDVNLRAPWWQKHDVYQWLQQSRWVKMNQDELRLLGFADNDVQQAMLALQSQFQVEQLILTQGSEGARVLTAQGEFHNVVPGKIDQFVDTVGAGDAFSAIYLHGLVAGWPITETLKVAQQFASRIIGVRGATSSNPDFYKTFINN